jgi:hypothetical protein
VGLVDTVIEPSGSIKCWKFLEWLMNLTPQTVTLCPCFVFFRILICSFRAEGQILVSVATKAPSKGSPNLNVLLLTEDSKGTCRYNLWQPVSGVCCPNIFMPYYVSNRWLIQLGNVSLFWGLKGSVVWSLDLILSHLNPFCTTKRFLLLDLIEII